MTRLPDWRPRLVAYLEDAARRPFRPGRHDCALFAAGAVAAQTGADPARGWRSRYRSLRRGRAALREAGFEDLAALAAHHLPEIPPIMAREGDIALLREAGELAFGVVQGPMIYVLRPDGLGLVPLTQAERAFRV